MAELTLVEPFIKSIENVGRKYQIRGEVTECYKTQFSFLKMQTPRYVFECCKNAKYPFISTKDDFKIAEQSFPPFYSTGKEILSADVIL
jgi:hypothetical protein